jgi:uncharacterized membrane protein (UPF0127 family)
MNPPFSLEPLRQTLASLTPWRVGVIWGVVGLATWSLVGWSAGQKPDGLPPAELAPMPDTGVVLEQPVVRVMSQKPMVQVLLNGEVFDLEVAATTEDQLKGLMFRDALEDKHGMLFSFQPARAVNFWMKNCKIPLDMVFIRGGQVAHVVSSAAPCLKDPCPVYPSLYTVDTVIELPAGSAQLYRIQPGDRVQVVSSQTREAIPGGDGGSTTR